MFELSIARKYLIPKKRRLSLTLISIVSIAMVTLVVWLSIVFLSITAGIEKGWLKKLTALNAPLTISPKDNYYSSYYYQIDEISLASSYELKNFHQKLTSPLTNPYDEDIDEEIPLYFSTPERNLDGSAKDLIKELYQTIQETNLNEPSIGSFETTGSLLKLRLIDKGHQGFITQASYVRSFAESSTYLAALSETPSAKDINHLLYLATISLNGSIQDVPTRPTSNVDQAATTAILSNIKIKKMKSLDGNSVLTGENLTWNGHHILEVDVQTKFSTPPKITPPWFHTVNGKGILNKKSILLPINYKNNNVKIGDTGYLTYGGGSITATEENRQEISVAGFYNPGIMAIGAKCILAPPDIVHTMKLSNKAFVIDKLHSEGVHVWFKDIENAADVKKNLVTALEKKGLSTYFHVESYQDYDYAKDLIQQFQSDKYLFTLVAIFILLVACSNIVSMLVLLVSDKRKEIAILKALGANNKSVALIFALVGGVMGLIATILGTIFAVITLHNINSLVGLLSLIQGHTLFNPAFFGTSLPSSLSMSAVYFIALLTPLISIVAALIPAIKASKVEPASMLRGG